MIKGDEIICTSNSIAYNITIGKKYIIEEVGSLVLNRNKIIIIRDDNDLYIRVHITYFKLVSVVRDEKLQTLLDWYS